MKSVAQETRSSSQKAIKCTKRIEQKFASRRQVKKSKRRNIDMIIKLQNLIGRTQNWYRNVRVNKLGLVPMNRFASEATEASKVIQIRRKIGLGREKQVLSETHEIDPISSYRFRIAL